MPRLLLEVVLLKLSNHVIDCKKFASNAGIAAVRSDHAQFGFASVSVSKSAENAPAILDDSLHQDFNSVDVTENRLHMSRRFGPCFATRRVERLGKSGNRNLHSWLVRIEVAVVEDVVRSSFHATGNLIHRVVARNATHPFP